MARQSQIIWQYWIFLISTRRSTFEFPKLLSQCKFQLESRKDKNIHWSHVSLCEDVSVEGVYTSLSIYIIMYTHIKTKHVTFELHSYIGPCPPEEVPTGILLPLHLKIDSSLTISSWHSLLGWRCVGRPTAQKSALTPAGCHFGLVSEKFQNSFQQPCWSPDLWRNSPCTPQKVI